MATVSQTPTPVPDRARLWSPQPLTPRSLGLLLPLTYLTLVLLGVGVLILWAGFRMQSLALVEAGDDLELQARLVANGIEEPLVRLEELEHGEGGEEEDERNVAMAPLTPDKTLIRLVTVAAENTSGRVTLTDARQRVIYSSDSAIPLGADLTAPEFTTQTRVVRRDDWTQDRRLFVATPVVRTSGALVGHVQLSIPITLVYGQIAQTWLRLLLAGGIVVILTMVISFGMARFILQPIRVLTRGADAIADGDLTQHVQPTGPDELRRLASAFNQMTERLRDLLARQRDFVAHAAHELRTPLTALGLRLEMVQTHRRANPELADHYLGQMTDEIEHLRRLTDHLLALAALDAHELPPRTRLDLAPILYQLADSIAPLLHSSGHTLKVEVPLHLPPVYANADQIRAAMRNLLDNAIKYTSPSMITLSAMAAPGSVQISVTDTGAGIPEHALPRIFDRFYRVDKARARKLGGAGLGLALVKGVAEAYGGRVEVTSQPGQGSCFTVVLPAAESPSARA